MKVDRRSFLKMSGTAPLFVPLVHGNVYNDGNMWHYDADKNGWIGYVYLYGSLFVPSSAVTNAATAEELGTIVDKEMYQLKLDFMRYVVPRMKGQKSWENICRPSHRLEELNEGV